MKQEKTAAKENNAAAYNGHHHHHQSFIQASFVQPRFAVFYSSSS
jgi:hypothetical protein